ncbi:MAG: hypothetical protein INR71_14500, partial [Terriglobus roseus]|nr:hypothetical protein [Terriglobus roseus]
MLRTGFKLPAALASLSSSPSSIHAKVMDSLLDHAFANLSAREPAKIRKGLRQIDGLLAHICLGHDLSAGRKPSNTSTTSSSSSSS